MEKKKSKGSRSTGPKGREKRSPKKKREEKDVVKVEPEKLDIKEEVKNDSNIGESIKDTEQIEPVINASNLSPEKIREEDIHVEERGDSIRAEEAQPEDKQEELLSFFLGDEEYAIDIITIKEIIGMMDITFVPRADDCIRGIISLRGAIIPIFDIRNRLGLREPGDSNKGRIIVISIDRELIGITVNGVAEVVKIRGFDIEPTPFTISGIDAEYIRGIVRYKGRIVILLDIVRLLKLQEGKNLR
ncbi:MAG: chemotaxis protein CheW [Nitrospirae bacterium]|nr:chemotaxis protein CheW [Nitrospirota bacterium]